MKQMIEHDPANIRSAPAKLVYPGIVAQKTYFHFICIFEYLQ
ncbi:hypothetical protein [Cohnella cellulosilytica]|uniref:Uncharacterized protein n=1 Tax=Cohnella cellulosilytica TaxID=986710 RepID=A0ABW2FPD1_9BACL